MSLVQAESPTSTAISQTPVVASNATSTADAPAEGDQTVADTGDSDQPMIAYAFAGTQHRDDDFARAHADDDVGDARIARARVERGVADHGNAAGQHRREHAVVPARGLEHHFVFGIGVDDIDLPGAPVVQHDPIGLRTIGVESRERDVRVLRLFVEADVARQRVAEASGRVLGVRGSDERLPRPHGRVERGLVGRGDGNVGPHEHTVGATRPPDQCDVGFADAIADAHRPGRHRREQGLDLARLRGAARNGTRPCTATTRARAPSRCCAGTTPTTPRGRPGIRGHHSYGST